jgi:hypothetical protein
LIDTDIQSVANNIYNYSATYDGNINDNNITIWNNSDEFNFINFEMRNDVDLGRITIESTGGDTSYSLLAIWNVSDPEGQCPQKNNNHWEGLIHYYSFDTQDHTGTFLADISLNDSGITIDAGTDLKEGGLINQSAEFDGSSKQYELNASTNDEGFFNPDLNWSASWWENGTVDDNSQDNVFINYQQTGTGRRTNVYYQWSADRFRVDGATNALFDSVKASIPRRNMILSYDRDNTNLTLYINGVKNESQPYLGFTAGGLLMAIGSEGGANYFSGGLDEMAFWQRTLNDTDISKIYNGGAGDQVSGFGVPVVNDAPSANNVAPDDNTVTSNTTVNFTGNYTDGDSDIGNCTLFLDGVENTSNSTLNSGEEFSLIIDNLTEGAHDWNFSCSDGTVTNITETRTVTVDLTQPVINANKPNSNNTTFIRNTTFQFDISITDNNLLDSCQLNVTENANTSNTPILNLTRDINLTTFNFDLTHDFTGNPDGTYDFEVSCNDSASASPPIPNFNPRVLTDVIEFDDDGDVLVSMQLEVLNPAGVPVSLIGKNLILVANKNAKGTEIIYGGQIENLLNGQKLRKTYTAHNASIKAWQNSGHIGHFTVKDKFWHHDDLVKKGWTVQTAQLTDDGKYEVIFFKSSYAQLEDFDPISGSVNVGTITFTAELDLVTPPSINQTTYNVTSATSDTQTQWVSSISSPVRVTSDTTPTVTFDLDNQETGNCSIGNSSLNHTDMIAADATTLCATTDTFSHTCTLPVTQAIEQGSNTLYISCADAQGNTNQTSGPLSISLDFKLEGYVLLETGNVTQEGGTVTAIDMLTNTTLAQGKSNSSGRWTLFTNQSSNYSVHAYAENDSTLRPDIQSHIEVQ